MDGLIIINKEKDYTSRDIVNIIGKKLNTNKVGHTGTLDPLATGVLVIAVGKALKLIEFLTNDTKEYIVEVKTGIKTDTYDITGNVLDTMDNYSLDENKINEVLSSFIGKQLQEVPIYSAVKVNGKKLYDYARNNESVDLPKKEIEIYNIELLSISKDSFKFKTFVSKGTYIRSLVNDISKKLDIYCTMSNLTRTKSGIFNIEECYSLNDIDSNNYKVISMYDAIKDKTIIEVDDFIKNKILNGRILENRYNDNLIFFVDKDKNVIGIYEIYDKDNTKIKPIKIIA